MQQVWIPPSLKFSYTNKPDIDAESIKWAKDNVKRNHLEHRIQIIQADKDGSIIPLDKAGVESVDFTMTNPPFYSSEKEMNDSLAKKNLPPSSACTGAPVEMVTEGGELAFVTRILDESLQLKNKVRWYTAMFGFLSSVTGFVYKLQEHLIDNYAVTEFVQGNKTRRWAVAWSFGAMRPSQAAARGTKAALSKNMLPAMTEFEVVTLPLPSEISAFTQSLESAIASLELASWNWDKQALSGTGVAKDKVWTRAWRRRKKREAYGNMEVQKPPETFGFRVWIIVGIRDINVHVRWFEGHDEFTFESFRGYLKDTAKAAAHDQAK